MLKIKHEAERKRIEEQKNIADIEKQRLLDQLKEKEENEKNQMQQ